MHATDRINERHVRIYTLLWLEKSSLFIAHVYDNTDQHQNGKSENYSVRILDVFSCKEFFQFQTAELTDNSCYVG